MTPVSPIFNGIFTIQSPSGAHRTFRIHTQPSAQEQLKKYPNRKPFAPDQRIISLLVGPDNGSDYSKFGFVKDDGIYVWQKFQSQTIGQMSLHEKYADMVWSLATKNQQSKYSLKGAKLHHEGRCIKCNRRLTTPESILLGIGPVCASGGRDME